MKQSDPEKERILIVDDEAQITRVLCMACTANGYEARQAPSGESALEVFGQWNPNLIITDLSMPGLSGVELCEEVRKISPVPIIVLSVRDQEKVKIQALDAGADDYVTKPFQINELLARVRSALRRASLVSDQTPGGKLEVGDFLIDAAGHQAFLRGAEVHLTPKEFALLHYLASHPGRVLTHRTIHLAIWGSYNVDQPESLRVLIAQLRRKIEPSGRASYIQTEPWIGYRFLPHGAPGSL